MVPKALVCSERFAKVELLRIIRDGKMKRMRNFFSDLFGWWVSCFCLVGYWEGCGVV